MFSDGSEKGWRRDGQSCVAATAFLPPQFLGFSSLDPTLIWVFCFGFVVCGLCNMLLGFGLFLYKILTGKKKENLMMAA